VAHNVKPNPLEAKKPLTQDLGQAQLNASLKRMLVNAVLVLASSALALAAAEVALRLLNKPAWDTEIRAGWKYQGADRYVNERGYRGQPIRYSDHDIVVVLLGDSQVESTTCPPDMMPERYLEQHLRQRDPRFKVFTLGSGGYGNDQEYLALKEYFEKYRADATAELAPDFFVPDDSLPPPGVKVAKGGLGR